MPRKPPVRITDIRGLAHLAIDATIGVTELVESLHHTITRVPGVFGATPGGRTRGITGLVYGIIRGATRGIGKVLDRVLLPLIPLIRDGETSDEREAILAALNGVLGDHLEARHNPLRIEMQFRYDGKPLSLTPDALATALPQAGRRILVLIHGLCMGERQWRRKEHDHGAALATDLGVSPVYLNYNTGLPIASNGRKLATMLEQLLATWPVPVERIDILAHSMGGLVARSACHYASLAGNGWLPRLRKLVFLGTPHHGAPLERGGNWVTLGLELSPYTAAFSRLAKIRSAGITDLRYGHLVDEDPGSPDAAGDAATAGGRDRFAHAPDTRAIVPLPPGVGCYALAAVLSADPGKLKGILGDGLVLRDSALGRHGEPRRRLRIPDSHCWTGYGMSHLDLLSNPAVYAKIREYLG